MTVFCVNRKKATRERKAPRKEGEDGYDPYDFDQSEASASEGTKDICTAFAYCIQGKFCPCLFLPSDLRAHLKLGLLNYM